MFDLPSQNRAISLTCGTSLNRQVAFPVDTSAILAALCNQYTDSREVIEVSFRSLAPWIKMGERATHHLHPYPAKLLPQIAHFFLAASSLSSPDDFVLDPFAGSGTVALETLMAGKRALYCDTNPLALFITRVKCRPLAMKAIMAAGISLASRYKRSRSRKCPDVVNIDYWYEPAVLRELARLKASLQDESDIIVRDFLCAAFSSVCRKASLADPRLSVPVRRKSCLAVREPVWTLFTRQLEANCSRMEQLNRMITEYYEPLCVGEDARSLQEHNSIGIKDASVRLIVTSPPYAGAQKYIRASSLPLGWLDLAPSDGLKSLEARSIGREHFRKSQASLLIETGLPEADALLARVFKENPTRAAIFSAYLLEIQAAINEMFRVLMPNGHVVFVIGDNEICGEPFRSAYFITQMFIKKDFVLKLKLIDSIKTRGLMTKRNRSAPFIASETVLMFQKVTA